MQEIFKDIPNYKGLYQVSNLGRIKSLKRIVKKGYSYRTIKQKILNQLIINKYIYTGLRKNKKQKLYLVHQLVAIVFLNHKPDGHKIIVDHIDNNPLNNHVNNLQLITQRENTSKDRFRGNYSSKYLGVCWNKKMGKWQVNIWVNYKNKYLGCFKTELEASKVYQNALKNILITK